jgi:hypothetical protein
MQNKTDSPKYVHLTRRQAPGILLRSGVWRFPFRCVYFHLVIVTVFVRVWSVELRDLVNLSAKIGLIECAAGVNQVLVKTSTGLTAGQAR